MEHYCPDESQGVYCAICQYEQSYLSLHLSNTPLSDVRSPIQESKKHVQARWYASSNDLSILTLISVHCVIEQPSLE